MGEAVGEVSGEVGAPGVSLALAEAELARAVPEAAFAVIVSSTGLRITSTIKITMTTDRKPRSNTRSPTTELAGIITTALPFAAGSFSVVFPSIRSTRLLTELPVRSTSSRDGGRDRVRSAGLAGCGSCDAASGSALPDGALPPAE